MRKGWEIKKLGDIGIIFNGNSINENIKKEKYLNIEDGLPFIATKDVGYDNVVDYDNGIRIPFGEKDNFKIAPANTIFICAEGGSAGRKMCFIDREVCFGNKLFALITKNNINSRFVYYWYFSENFQKEFKTGLAGIIGGVSLNKFREIQIPIPTLSEQQEIVSILDEAFTAIDQANENLQRNLQNAKDLFQSELNNIFENKGKDWIEKEFQETVDASCTLSYGIVQPGDEFPNGIAVVRPTDLIQKTIGLSGLKHISPSIADGYKRTTLKGDELLLCVRGTTGVVSIASEELNGANVTRGIVPILFDSTLLRQEFGYYLTISPYFQKQIKAKTYGAALMQINIGDLRKVTIPFPPLNKQKKIVSQLDTLSNETKKLENIYQKKLDNLEELKKSILQKAFSGELTSPERASSANDGHSPSKKKASSIKSPERA